MKLKRTPGKSMLAMVLTALIIAVLPATVVAEDWIPSGSATGHTWHIKPRSLEVTTNKAGDEIVVVIGKHHNLNTSIIVLEKWYVTIADCAAGQGRLTTNTISGEYKNHNDFVFGSGTVASTIAELICGASKTRAEPSKWGT